jgi:hypothetical protein
MTVGVLVASAALTTAQSNTASAAEVDRRGGGAAGRRQQLTRSLGSLPEFPDPRLHGVPESLASSLWLHDREGFGAFQGPASSPDPQTRRFDIQPGPLGDVLNRFEQVTGVTAILSIEPIGTIQSPGVVGVYSIEGALDALLSGTSVTFRLTGPKTAVVELAGRTEIQRVSAEAPDHPAAVQLTGVYHNLLRRWAEI